MIEAGVLVTSASTPTNSLTASKPVAPGPGRPPKNQISPSQQSVRSVSTFTRNGISRNGSSDVDTSLSLFDAFVRQSIIILKRLTPDLASNDPENRYVLRARPNAGFRLEHEEEFSGDSLETLKIETPAEAVLNGLLDGLDRNAFIKLVSVGGGGNGHNGPGGLAILPRPQRFVAPGGPRWAGDTGGRTSRARPVGEKIALAMDDGDMRSVALKLRPETALAVDRNAQAMIVSGVAKPLDADSSALAGLKLNWALDDWQLINHSKERPRHLPIVNNANDPIWPDRIDSHKFWYAPTFELLQPAANSSPQSSPFQFTFRRIGETESGPALEGEIRFTLRRSIGRHILQALHARGNPAASPVPTANLAISLVLPFINSNDNTLTRHTCPCTVSLEGDDVVATVALTTQWVRIAYTVLSNPSASPEPARLSVAYSYEAYTSLRRFDVKLAFGNKAALIPLVFSAEQMREVQGLTFMDARASTLNFAEGSVLLKREAILLSPGPPNRDERANLRASVTRARPQVQVELADVEAVEAVEAVEVKKPKGTTLGHIAKPAVQPSIELAEIIRETALARRTLLRQEQHDAVFPCNVLGTFYRETSDEADLAVGCRRALELGQVSYRRYERIPELDSVLNGETLFQVYRSLQQPGRFLVLPARYVISRHSPETPDAYKARVLLYSDEDPTRAVRTPIIFRADLQPDIDLHARRELDIKLAQLSGRPVVEYPTAIESETAFVFLAMDSTPVSAVRTPDSFSVSISATAADWPLLFTRLQTGGVVGQVRFILGDGTELSSNLILDLRHITGPWTSGAVTAEKTGDAVRLTNRIDRPASVHDLMIVSDNKSRLVPVERMLSAGNSETVVIEALPNQAELFPVYTTPPTPEAIEAVPNAIERIHINVLFTNQILFSAHNLTAMDIFARRTGSQTSEQIHVGAETTVVQADFLLPLTEYISEPAIQLRIVKTFSDGHQEIKEWFNWELNTMGFVVSLTWNFVQ